MSGLKEIIAIAETMNHCKPRTDIARVLGSAPDMPDLFAASARGPE
jgi:hypothetical protein